MLGTEYYNQEVTVPLLGRVAGLDNRPTFQESNYEEMVGRLSDLYLELRQFMNTPAVVRYDDLVSLRRRAGGPDATSHHVNRIQTQLRLAADLLRLGRRHEADLFLSDLENRLLNWENRLRSQEYLLWTALLRAASGDKQAAFSLAVQLCTQGTDPVLDRQILSFFQTVRNPAQAN